MTDYTSLAPPSHGVIDVGEDPNSSNMLASPVTRTLIGFVPRKVWTLASPTPFDSIENTHEYFRLLCETVLEVKGEIEADISDAESKKLSRRLEALRLVHFKLQKLQENVNSSSRLLNDLRTLRRLLLEERLKTAESKPKTDLK